MTRFLFLNHDFRFDSGIDRVIYTLANELRSQGHEVLVVTLTNTFPQREGVKIIDFRIKNQFFKNVFPFFLLPKFKTLIKDYNPDIVNTHHYPSNEIANHYRTKFMHIQTLWADTPEFLFPGLKERLYYNFVKRSHLRTAKQAELIIYSSEHARNWILKNLDLKKNLVRLYMDIIDFKYFNPLKKTVSEARADLSRIGIRIDKDLHYFIYVGRISPHKGIENLIIIARILKTNFNLDNFRILLVGRQEDYPLYMKNLESMINKWNLTQEVIFLGSVTDSVLFNLYKISSVFITGTRWEGFLRAEPMSMGLPMIAFDIGPNKETIKNGYNGYIVEAFDHVGFAQKLKDCIYSNLKQEQGKTIRDWAKKRFDVSIIAKRFAGIAEGVFNLRMKNQ